AIKASNHYFIFFFSSRRRHTRWPRDWSSDVCSSDLAPSVKWEACIGDESGSQEVPDPSRVSGMPSGASGPDVGCGMCICAHNAPDGRTVGLTDRDTTASAKASEMDFNRSMSVPQAFLDQTSFSADGD